MKIKRLNKDAIVPTYGSDYAACLDLYAIEDIFIPMGVTNKVRCGWVFEIPEGYEINIVPRSGLACKYGLIIPNSPCIIDSDYRGEIVTYFMNLGNKPILIKKGDRYAQMSLRKSLKVGFEVVNELSETDRDDGSFGSTGK